MPPSCTGQMRLGETAVGAGTLQRRAGVGKFAEGVDGDARHGALMRRGTEASVTGLLIFDPVVYALLADVGGAGGLLRTDLSACACRPG